MAEATLGKRILKGVLILVGINIAFVAISLFTIPGLLIVYDPFLPHPIRDHGSKPSEFEALWVRWDAVSFDQPSMILHNNGDVSDMPTMAYRRWHFNRGSLYIDMYSRCGNDIPLARPGKYSVEFDGPDRMHLQKSNDKWPDYSGWYERVDVTEDLRERLEAEKESEDVEEARRARLILMSIAHAEDRGLTICEPSQ